MLATIHKAVAAAGASATALLAENIWSGDLDPLSVISRIVAALAVGYAVYRSPANITVE